MENQMPEKEFNLLYEPWILVKTNSNKVKKYSLLEVFKYAHEVQQLAGELPTQDIAIMRLLLAVMHAAFVGNKIKSSENAIELWQMLWELQHFPYEIIEEYLKKYEERFWLFHPECPFYQINSLVGNLNKFRNKKESEEIPLKSVANMIGELSQSDNKVRLFPSRTGKQQKNLSYDEAARWLIHLNGFDDTATKNPSPKGVGYLGRLGLIYVEGKSLFETLMLNFVLLDNKDELFDDNKEKTAYWEKPVCKKIMNLIAQPNAQKDLLTIQSRRILLKRENRYVTGYYLTMGDYFDDAAVLYKEQMTGWRKDKNSIFIPKKHSPERQMWRDFSSLLNSNATRDMREPGVIHWLKYLKNYQDDQDNVILSVKYFRIYVVGVEYLQDASHQIKEYINDSLRINSNILNKLNSAWIDMIVDLLVQTDQAVTYLGSLASDIATAEGNSDINNPNKKQVKIKMKTSAREQGYFSLDGAFRKWISSIDPQKDSIEEKRPEWINEVKKIIFELGESMMSKCSDKALIGYIKEDSKKHKKNLSALNSYNIFKASVIKILN